MPLFGQLKCHFLTFKMSKFSYEMDPWGGFHTSKKLGAKIFTLYALLLRSFFRHKSLVQSVTSWRRAQQLGVEHKWVYEIHPSPCKQKQTKIELIHYSCMLNPFNEMAAGIVDRGHRIMLNLLEIVERYTHRTYIREDQ